MVSIFDISALGIFLVFLIYETRGEFPILTRKKARYIYNGTSLWAFGIWLQTSVVAKFIIIHFSFMIASFWIVTGFLSPIDVANSQSLFTTFFLMLFFIPIVIPLAKIEAYLFASGFLLLKDSWEILKSFAKNQSPPYTSNHSENLRPPEFSGSFTYLKYKSQYKIAHAFTIIYTFFLFTYDTFGNINGFLNGISSTFSGLVSFFELVPFLNIASFVIVHLAETGSDIGITLALVLPPAIAYLIPAASELRHEQMKEESRLQNLGTAHLISRYIWGFLMVLLVGLTLFVMIFIMIDMT